VSDLKIVVGGRLIDGTGAELVEDSVVVIEGKKFKAIGKKGEIDIPAGAEVIDASGKVVLPGLIEAHTHPLGERGFEPKFKKYYDNLVSSPVLPLLKGVEVLRKLLRYGVTTVRILHGAIPSAHEMRGEWLVALRTAVERGYFPAPRVVAAGCVFPTAGHIYSMVPPSLVRPGWRGADGVWEVRRQVRECLAEDVDVIKLLGPTGGGGLGHDAPKVQGCTLEEIEVAVEEASWKGVMVSAHAHGGPGLKNAVLAGVDTIEHGTFLHEQPDVVEMMAEKGTYLVPTMGARFHPVYSDYEKAKKGQLEEDEARKVLETAEAITKSFKAAHRAGVKIAAGTDFMRFDVSPLAWELCVYVREGGMTPMEAIVSATKTAAEACGLCEAGTIEEGKLADLIVVDGDPLQEISVLQDSEKITVVIKDGEIQVKDGKIIW
jgi:imidazolonepropionase-like amidohydrolase